MSAGIDSLVIERYRALQRLQINGIGRVNLITGQNNTGKSSVLEAVRIWASGASLSEINRILHYREEDVNESGENARSAEGDGYSMIASLFSGFPALNQIDAPIVITAKEAKEASQPRRLSISVGQFVQQRGEDGMLRLVPLEPSLIATTETETVPALIVEGEAGKRIVPLHSYWSVRKQMAREDWPVKPLLPCVFSSPYGAERTGALGALWDTIALSDKERHVVEALRIINPDIVAVSMVGGENPRHLRTAMARSNRISRRVPLRSFGDGLNRLFGIFLSLVNAQNGLLLIDEVENGMHYSVQLDLWRSIFRLSRDLNIQVFATSHSWDAVEAFQKAASEAPEDGALIRLSRRGDAIIPTVFCENELAIVTRDHIEVR
jgi:hypothetical protein